MDAGQRSTVTRRRGDGQIRANQTRAVLAIVIGFTAQLAFAAAPQAVPAQPQEIQTAEVSRDVHSEITDEVRYEREALERQADRQMQGVQDLLQLSLTALGIIVAAGGLLAGWFLWSTRRELRESIEKSIDDQVESMVASQAGAVMDRLRAIEGDIGRLAGVGTRSVVWVARDDEEAGGDVVAALRANGVACLSAVVPNPGEPFETGSPELAIVSYDATAEGSRRLVEVLRQLQGRAPPVPLIVYTFNPAGAQGSHNYLRSLLNTGQMAQRIANSYLSGSYARDTAIRPIDDVDVVFEISPLAWGGGLNLLMLLPPPERILESFANAIRYRYPVSSVFGQRRSVRLSPYHLDIDVVPAVPDRQQLWLVSIPDRESGEWIKSAPRKHQAVAAEVNASRQGRFKPLVKLLKYWNSNLPETIRAKSFMVETLATHLFRSVPFDSVESGLIFFWDFVATRFGSPGRFAWRDQYGMSFGLLGIIVPDAAGTGSNTASGFAVNQFSNFSSKARISRDRLIAAQSARSGETLRAHIDGAFRA